MSPASNQLLVWKEAVVLTLLVEFDEVAFGRHVSAMTTEGLHSKSDIAAELAWRDSEIARLERELASERFELKIYKEELEAILKEKGTA